MFWEWKENPCLSTSSTPAIIIFPLAVFFLFFSETKKPQTHLNVGTAFQALVYFASPLSALLYPV